MLRVHGEAEKYHHDEVGINSRLDEVQAAVLRIKLPHLEEWIQLKLEKAERYKSLFADAGIDQQVTAPFVRPDGRHVFHLFVIRVRKRIDALSAYLGAHGVGNGVYYPVPLHLQKCFAYLGYKKGQFPAAERAASETVALPIYAELTNAQQDYVVGKLVDFFQQ
jgi:dTDP-4-amino-4,6-dideoxygalactose transaminase